MFGGLLVHSTQEPGVSPLSWQGWPQGTGNRECLLRTLLYVCIKTHATEEGAGRGRWKEVRVREQPPALSARAVQQAADSSRSQRWSEDSWKPDVTTKRPNQELGHVRQPQEY